LVDQPASRAPAAAAGLGRRLGSLCYEVLLLAALFFAGGFVFLPVSRVVDPALARPLFQFCLLVLAAVYFIYCWTHGGQTLPMKTWRIRVVARDGRAVTLRTGALRYLFALLSVASCGLGFAWAAFDRDRQFLHDRLAGTRIIRV